MKSNPVKAIICCSFLLLQYIYVRGQDKRVQYPPVLLNSYFGVNIGYINYPFDQNSLEPGYTAGSVEVPHIAVKILLIGHQFTENISAQISYMRPVNWVKYKNINGDQASHSVWMNVAGLSVKGQFPLRKKLSLYGEAGFDIVTRHGFEINDIPVVKDASYASLLAGGGITYHLNDKWDLVLGSVWSPRNKKEKQPQTLFISGGFNLHMRALSKEKVERNANSKAVFPRNLVQVGYTTNALGYGVNDFVSKGAIPIFWGGSAEISRGITVQYQQNIFHARKVFSLDWGAGMSLWRSNINKEKFFTVSLFPVFRFTALRTRSADLYFNYSVAGPSFISRVFIDNEHSGSKFTFHDFMGMGVFAGNQRHFNAEIRISHYSNGNIFPNNAGLKIPLTFNLGYTFN
jgi:hypothetical protein